MSEFAGELKVKIVPDTQGFQSDLQSKMSGLSPRVQAMMQRTGLAKSLEETDQVGKQLAQTQTVLAQRTEEVARAQGRQLTSVRSLARSYGVAGIAVTAGIQAARELSQTLRVQGQEAGTVEGRFRNLGAELLTGNVIGGIKAIGVASSLTAGQINELVTGSYRVAAGFDAMKASADAAAIGANEAAKQLKGVAEAQAAFRGQAAVDFGNRKENVISGPNGDITVARGTSPEDRGGLRGAGAINQINSDLEATAGIRKERARVEREAAKEQSLQTRALRAQLTAGLKDDLAVAKAQEALYQGRVKNARKGSADEQAALTGLTQAHSQVDSIEQSILANQKEFRAKQVERARQEIDLAQTQLQIEEVRARTDSQESAAIQKQAALANKAATDQRFTKEERLGYELQAAQADKQLYDIQQRQAAEAEQRRKDALEARKREVEAEAQRYRDTLSLEEQRLQIRVQAAQLTDKNLKDDRAAIKAEIAFYKAEQKDRKLSVQERLTARSNEISARLQLKGLGNQSNAGGQSAALTSQSFFSAAAGQFNTYGSNIAGRGGVLSGQDARAAYASKVLSGAGAQNFAQAVERARATQAAQQQAELQRQTALLRLIAKGVRLSSGVPGPFAESIKRSRQKAFAIGGQ